MGGDWRLEREAGARRSREGRGGGAPHQAMDAAAERYLGRLGSWGFSWLEGGHRTMDHARTGGLTEGERGEQREQVRAVARQQWRGCNAAF